MSFVFTDENLEKIKAHVAKYPKNRQASAVLPLLDLAQRQCGGWLPQPAIEEVSKLLDMPFMQLALAGKADYLVSGDHDLLSLAGQFSCPIITADQFIKTLNK